MKAEQLNPYIPFSFFFVILINRIIPLMRLSRTFILLLMINFLSGCHVARFFYWNFADVNDHRRFPYFTVQHDEPFFVYTKSNAYSFNEELLYEGKQYKLIDDFLSRHKTTAFLIIKSDSIIYERYFDGYSMNSLLPSFSVSKSFVSALVGCAIEDGYISSIDDMVTDYVPEMKDRGFSRVSIRNLLNMRSGIHFNEGYFNPFGEMAKFYYGLDLQKYVMNLKTEQEPGEEYKYQSGNTQILGIILQRATGKNPAEYLEEKIWKPAGMRWDATWNYDSEKHKTVKAFCCLNARARDFAKFGRLYLNEGKFNDLQLIPTEWVKMTLNNQTSSVDSQGYPYHMHWRVRNDGSLFAKGILGQYIYIMPHKDMIILRFGKTTDNIDWIRFMDHLIGQYQL